MMHTHSQHVSAFLVLFSLCSFVFAVPAPREEHFTAPLNPRVWELLEGDSAAAGVADGSLLLGPSASGLTSLRYRFYPLRETGSRPAFGDFSARVDVRASGNSAPFAFGLMDAGDWRLWIELDQAGARARITLEAAGQRQVGEWKQLNEGAETLGLVFLRRGSTVAAQVVSGGSTVPLGQWKGTLAPILDFGLRAARSRPEQVPTQVRRLRIDPLPAEAVAFTVLPREGRELPLEEELESHEHIGGHFDGGYLWPRDAAAELNLALTNVSSEPASGQFHLRVVDLYGEAVGERTFPFHMDPHSEGRQTIALPVDRYGFYIAHLTLLNAAGEPVGAPEAVTYGITAAPLPSELGPNNSVGVHTGPFARVGAKWTRFHDNGGRAVTWSGVQPEKDRWDWAGLDAYVARCMAAGVEPLAVLAMTPEWASTDPATNTYRGRGAYSPPKDIADWIEYCRRMAERYKGRIRYYEIWNEPNNNHLADRGFFFHAPVEKYYELAKAAYDTIKAVDPDAKILAPSGTGHFFPFLERFMELGGGETFDILSIHTYTTPFPPEIGYPFNNEKSYLHRVTRSREILAEHGFDKPIWNTEIGYQSGANTFVAGVPLHQDLIAAEALPGYWPDWRNRWDFRPADPRRAAAFITRFYILSTVYGVEKTFYHHRLMAHWSGTTSPVIAAPAVGFFSRLLGEASFVRSYDWHPQVQAHLLRTPEGRHVLASWRVEEESLRMGTRDDRTLGEIETAPVAGIEGIQDQRPVAVISGERPRETYFPTGREHPLQLLLNQVADAAYDVWGNPVPPEAVLGLQEFPVYLVFDEDPGDLLAEVRVGPAADQPRGADLRSIPGRLLPLSAQPLSISSKISDQFGGSLIQLGNRAAELTGTDTHHEIPLGSGNAATWTIPEGTAGAFRLLLGVRSSSQRPGERDWPYRVEVNSETAALQPWTPWPESIKRSGGTWQEISGYLISESVTLAPGDTLRVTSPRANARLYEFFLWPQK